MLVLSRKVNEEILIGDTIRLRVMRTRKNDVRIGIEAPDEVRIVRSELLDGIATSHSELVLAANTN